MNLDAPLAPSHEEAATGVVVACSAQTVRVAIDGGAAPLARLLSRWPHFLRLDKGFPEGCYCHPKTPWLGRSEFTGSTDHYYG